MNKNIELDAPNVSEREKAYLCKCIDSGFISTFGPFVEEFEKKFAQYLGVERAVSLQSGTAALHMVLHELGIGPQDEVIVPALTFVATASPVRYVGADPIFVDVNRKTWNIDTDEIEKKISAKTKAIIPVHLYGNPCNMEGIVNIARQHNLYVIEDATESLGAKYKGKYSGTLGDWGCFSFNGNKVITTGGGGMVIGIDLKRLAHIKFLINQARDDAKGYYHPEIGFNCRMTNLEASLGLAQLERLVEFLEKKKKFNQIYREELKDIEFIHFQEEYAEAESCWWLTCIVFGRRIDLDVLQKNLRQKGVLTRRIFMPLVDFPPYQKYKEEPYTNSYYIYERGLCLPSSTLNSFDDIFYACKIIKDFCKKGV